MSLRAYRGVCSLSLNEPYELVIWRYAGADPDPFASPKTGGQTKYLEDNRKFRSFLRRTIFASPKDACRGVHYVAWRCNWRVAPAAPKIFSATYPTLERRYPMSISSISSGTTYQIGRAHV